MNADILKSAGVDYDGGVKRFVGRAALYEKALSKFPKDETYTRICAAYESGDNEQLLACAHEFKGMCGNVGLASLHKAADAMVQTLRQSEISLEKLCAEYTLLESEYKKIFNAICSAMEE